MKFNSRPIYRCKNCQFYPKKCQYWDNKFRKEHPNFSFIKSNTEHNCPDFTPVYCCTNSKRDK